MIKEKDFKEILNSIIDLLSQTISMSPKDEDIKKAIRQVVNLINYNNVTHKELEMLFHKLKKLKNIKFSTNSINNLQHALQSYSIKDLDIDSIYSMLINPKQIKQKDVHTLTKILNDSNETVKKTGLKKHLSKGLDISSNVLGAYGMGSYLYDQYKTSNNESIAIGEHEKKYQKKVSDLEALDFTSNFVPILNKLPNPLGALASDANNNQELFLQEKKRLMRELASDQQQDLQVLDTLLKQELTKMIAERTKKRREEAEITAEIEDFERKEVAKTTEESIINYDSIGNAYLNVHALMNNELNKTQQKIRELYLEYRPIIELIDSQAQDFVVQKQKEMQTKGLVGVRDFFESRGKYVHWSSLGELLVDESVVDTSRFKLIDDKYMASESILNYILNNELLSAANGAVIDKNQLAILHGTQYSPEFVVNSPQMKRLMKQVLNDVNQGSAFKNSKANLTVHFNVDKIDANSIDDVKGFVDIFTNETMKQLKMRGVNI